MVGVSGVLETLVVAALVAGAAGFLGLRAVRLVRGRKGCGAAGSKPIRRRIAGRVKSSKQTMLLTGLPGSPKT